ncbi:MAG: hypothetical protein IJH34_00065 [Romboutsia sp.]|nr:hypothetical protein [Romboutsia sp.]
MSESLRNKGDEFLFGNIEFLSKITDEFNNERDILNYIRDVAVSKEWSCEICSSNSLLLSSKNNKNKKNILIYSSLDTFNQMSDDFIEPKRKDIVISDDKIYTQDTILKERNIINTSKILSIIEKKIETNFSWELIESEYNVNILVYSNKETLNEEILKKITSDIIICFDGGYNNLLEITQPNNLIFDLTKNIEYNLNENANNYSLDVDVIFKNNKIEKKEKFNSIKINLDILDELKKEFNINIVDIYNQSKINDRKYSSKITFSTNEEDVNSIMNYIKKYNENIKENLNNNAVGVRVELKKLKNNINYKKSITEEFIKDIKNLFDDVYNIMDENIIVNLAEIFNEDDFLSINGTIKLSCIDKKIEIKNKLNELANKYKLELNFTNEIPIWAIDKNKYLRSVAIKNYRKSNLKANKIITVTNSKYVTTLNDKNNNIISYVYQISNNEYDKEYVRISDIIKNWSSIGSILDELMPIEGKEAYSEKYNNEDEINQEESDN